MRPQERFPATNLLTFHDLRHFYASLLISRGASVEVIQARLRHKSAVETLDTYGHPWPDDEDLTRQAVDAILQSEPACGASPAEVRIWLA